MTMDQALDHEWLRGAAQLGECGAGTNTSDTYDEKPPESDISDASDGDSVRRRFDILQDMANAKI